MAKAKEAAPAKVTTTSLIGDFEALEALLYESGGEVTPEIEEWMAEYDLAEQEKVDAYGFYLKDLATQAEGLNKLEGELRTKRQTLTNRAEWLKGRMLTYLAARGKPEVKGKVWSLKRVGAGGKRALTIIAPIEDLPEEYINVVTEKVIDKDALRAACEAAPDGVLLAEFEGVLAKLEPQGHYLKVG